MTARNEKLLIAEARRGSLSAFRELVEHHKQPVYYLALDLCGNHHDAEDISQEVFIRAYRSIRKFEGRAKLGTWLYRIAVNCFIDSRRKKQMNTISMHDGAAEAHLQGEALRDRSMPSPEQGAQAAGIQEHIEHALAQLTPRERTVFVLRHYNDLPLREIAHTLDIAEGTVKSLLFRAIRGLQRELAFYRTDLGLEE